MNSKKRNSKQEALLLIRKFFPLLYATNKENIIGLCEHWIKANRSSWRSLATGIAVCQIRFKYDENRELSMVERTNLRIRKQQAPKIEPVANEQLAIEPAVEPATDGDE